MTEPRVSRETVNELIAACERCLCAVDWNVALSGMKIAVDHARADLARSEPETVEIQDVLTRVTGDTGWRIKCPACSSIIGFKMEPPT